MTAPEFPLEPPHEVVWEHVVRASFREDLGLAGDLTTESIVPTTARLAARIVSRQAGVIAGLTVAAKAFAFYDPSLVVSLLACDGDAVSAGQVVATVAGSARSVLTAERTALNLLGRLSGIATTTRGVVDAIAGTGASVVCTRKTTPGLRALEKYAVRAGGGANHRFGLDDAVLVKDNHLAVAGSVAEAVRRVQARVGHLVKIEVEVDNLDQLDQLLDLGVDAVLLDNLGPDLLAEAVRRVGGRILTEASGGITPERALPIAQAGVDLLSIGWLTHSARCLDLGLDL